MKKNKQSNFIAPSILSANFLSLGEEIVAVEKAGADYIHFDVMDNHFVPNLTFGPLICRAVRSIVEVPIDVHLMVSPVDRLIEDFIDAGASIITFHPEASNHIDRSLSIARDNGCKTGLVLNPATPINCLDWVLPKLDIILIMSVNPGFGGQTFIENTFSKIIAVRQKIDEFLNKGGHSIRLEVDGGIKVENIQAVKRAGADTFVIGSGIFNFPDASQNLGYQKIMTDFRKALEF
ncbi:MAG: ribulose-phosphate 3-epimerase [Betaproteobacteria bacterium TMED41]|nr:MAG: ribulose-phosphate 3-epimerase [Betaproteobacteria bacterium TMED41]|tara:strand:+ start:3099 stop:3803 length:705 start_codon:yes stop_codon:yes gene_type:complete